MQIVDFDKNGNLFPYDLMEINLESLKYNFVDSMKEREHRNVLYNFLMEYNKHLLSIVKTDYVQWINGSFVTKALKPKDIDLVTFLDFSIIKQNIKELEKMVFPFSFEKYRMDAYIVRVYPESHEKFVHSKSDTLYWMHHFLKTKPDKFNRTFPKGFVKIINRYEK